MSTIVPMSKVSDLVSMVTVLPVIRTVARKEVALSSVALATLLYGLYKAMPWFLTKAEREDDVPFKEYKGLFHKIAANMEKDKCLMYRTELKSMKGELGLGTDYHYVVADPLVMKEWMDLCKNKTPYSGQIYKWFAGQKDSILSLSSFDKRWYNTRKASAPAFQPKILRQNVSQVHLKIKEFMETLVSTEKFDMARACVACTLDILGVTMFNYDLKTMEGLRSGVRTDGVKIIEGFKKVNAEIHPYVVNPLYKYMWWNEQYKDCMAAREEIYDVIKKMIKNFFKSYTPEQRKSDPGLLAHIFRAKGYDKLSEAEMLTNQLLLADLYALIFAGHDTTGYHSAWTLIHLMQNPDKLLRLRQELDAVVPPGECVGLEHIKAVPYITHCANESLRLHNPAIFVKRVASQDLVHPLSGHRIEKGSEVEFNMLLLGRNYQLDEPLAFRPERYETGTPEEINLLKDSTLPFSYGARNCVGQNKSKLDGPMIIGTVIMNLNLEMLKQGKAFYGLVVRPNGFSGKAVWRRDNSAVAASDGA